MTLDETWGLSLLPQFQIMLLHLKKVMFMVMVMVMPLGWEMGAQGGVFLS